MLHYLFIIFLHYPCTLDSFPFFLIHTHTYTRTPASILDAVCPLRPQRIHEIILDPHYI